MDCFEPGVRVPSRGFLVREKGGLDESEWSGFRMSRTPERDAREVLLLGATSQPRSPPSPGTGEKVRGGRGLEERDEPRGEG